MWHEHEYWPASGDSNRAVELLKNVGLGHLCGADGCLCMSCEILGFHIDVACRKSSGGDGANLIRVWSNSLDTIFVALHAVAIEVLAQIVEADGYNDCKVRFCSFEEDCGRKCIYCGGARAAETDYLCLKCQQKDEAQHRAYEKRAALTYRGTRWEEQRP